MTAEPQRDHVVADQSEVFAFLADPRTYGIAEPVRRIDTHAAVVFLAGSQAYKVKRAVRFPFLDFSTLEKRHAASAAEIEVNRTNAPELYLGVVPVTRSDGRLALGGDGEVVEWAVRMRRFDETATLDRLAERGPLAPDLVVHLVRTVCASHARAPRRDGEAALASLARYIRDNDMAFRETPEHFPPARAMALTAASTQALAGVRDLLRERGRLGHVRRCHGDLHLGNIVLLEGVPTLFDAIEFDDGIATGDVLYDLAFLLMDLWDRGQERAANQVLNRYLLESGDDVHLQGLAALSLFLSLRAAIRAKVTAAALPHVAGRERRLAITAARRYFGFAEAFLEPVPPRLVAIGGLSGSGKSTVAAGLAPTLGRPPGAVHLRSDVERKTLFGVEETRRLPPDCYVQQVTDDVYARLRRKAALALAAGQSVILDAVHGRPEERDRIEIVAREAGAAFAGLWLEAPLDLLLRRVERRKDDPSDATAEVVHHQASYETGPIGWTRLDISGDAENVLDVALTALGLKSG